ncbi:hypothetical protein KJ992_03675, partial [Patescibacteria group bacterium]|nr:hypothetical protein [Patescibacteria group bacterium]
QSISSSDTTNASGTSQVVLTTSHTAGDNYTITASTTLGSASSTSGVIEVDNGTAHHYNIDTIANQTAGVPFSAQVSVRDAYENLVDNFAGTSTMTIASSTGAAPGIAPDGTVPVYPVSHTWNGAEYVYEFTGITLYKAETNRRIAVNDSGSLISDDSNNFDITYATGTAYLATPNTPQNIRAGYLQAITGQLVDDYENQVKQAGVSVDLSVTNASGTPGIITPSSATTDSNGQIGISPTINYAVSTTTGHTATITLNSATPLASGTSSVITTIPGDIDHFELTNYPTTVVAGETFNITATAYDAYNNVKTDCDRSVWFTSTDGDPYPADLPATSTSKYTFDPAENGVHIFTGFALKNLTLQTIYIHYNPIGGDTGYITVLPNIAVKLYILDPAFSAQAGTSTTMTVAILDEFDNPATSTSPVAVNLSSGSTGTYHFYITGTTNIITSVSIPAGATSTTFDYYDEKTGSPTITATDAVSVLTPDTQQETITPAGLGSFDITNEPASVIAGQAFGLTVTAYDLFGNLKTNYAGTITGTTTAQNALTGESPVIPFPYTFSATTDNGVHVFNGFRFYLSGATSTVTVIDGSVSTTSSSILTNPFNIHHLGLEGIADPITAGETSGCTVTAYDAYNNIKTDYTETITFYSTDPGLITLPSYYTFTSGDNGQKVFDGVSSGQIVQLKTAGEQFVRAYQVNAPIITGQQNDITVEPAALDHFVFNTISTPQTAGDAFEITVTAYDEFDNIKTNYTGTSTLSDTTGTISPVLLSGFNDGVAT